MDFELLVVVAKLTSGDTVIGYGVSCTNRNKISKLANMMFDNLQHIIMPYKIDDYGISEWVPYSVEKLHGIPTENCMILATADSEGIQEYLSILNEKGVKESDLRKIVQDELVSKYNSITKPKHTLH